MPKFSAVTSRAFILISESHATSSPLSAHASGPLRGRLRPPGDKSVSHRALILGLLSVGKTEISGLLEGEDVIRTAEACRQLGARIIQHGAGAWSVEGVGLGSLLQPSDTLDFGNAGTGSRLMMGVVAGHSLIARFDGDASLRKRPMKRILDPLLLQGAQVIEQSEGGRLPLVLQGTSEPLPIEYKTPVASAQIKSAILLCGLNSPGRTVVLETEASRDHTEKMLHYFGASITSEPYGSHGRKITLSGRPELTARAVVVPVDPSSAAFPLVAAIIVPDSQLLIEGVMTNPLRTGLFETLREMGADIEFIDPRIEGGEEIADIKVNYSNLRGVDVPASRAPSMIDEYPILAIAASFAEGETRMRGLSELRVKESDRLAAIADGLKLNGVSCSIIDDDLIVQGSPVQGGGFVKTHLDHRIAMSFLVMGLASKQTVTVDDAQMISTSFPQFRSLMQNLGAQFS